MKKIIDLKVNNKEKNTIFRLYFIEKGNGKCHVDEIIERGRAAISAIFRNEMVLEIKNLKMHERILYPKVLPVIEYREEVWGGETTQQLEFLKLLYYRSVWSTSDNSFTDSERGYPFVCGLGLSKKDLFSLKLLRSI